MENYIVSARKYRPSTFESVVGQKSLTETLRNAIRQNHLAHAYLFCGPRGVGKTTCARIFAKTINCLNPTDGHDACNECESCMAFNEQRSFNIHELDAASNNSVEDIRSLIDQVRIPPQIGKYSVYIIDEVHMLSSGAFNALLKTLEEPPSYAIFILATTEKHKVLPTILSRCQVYDFSRITVADIISHLQYVAGQEGINASEEALNVVAQKADGGMRDALSIFDQLVAFCGNEVTYERAIEVLNVLDTDYYFRLVEMALHSDVSGALLLLNEVLQKGFDAGHFIIGFAEHLRDVLVSKDPQTVVLLETSEAIRKHYAQQAQICTPQWLFAALGLINDCDIHYRTAKNKRLTIEIALIKLCQLTAPHPAVQQPQVQTQSQPSPQPKSQPSAVQSAQPVAPKPQTSVPAQSQEASKVPSVQSEPQTAKVPQAPNVPQMPKISSVGPQIPQVPSTGPQIPSVPSAGPQIPQVPSAGPQIPSVNLPQTDVTTTSTSTNTSSQVKGQNNPFTEDQFVDAWAGLSSLFPKEQRLLTILTDYRPKLVSPNLCVMSLANPWQQEEIKRVAPTIMKHIRSVLKNDGLKLEVKVEVTGTIRAYTDEEKYKLLVEKNSTLKTMTDVFNLQLE